ncbi:18317_t:CDS:2 [Dentiscutata erythropus]|uniref:18317_t:CDS:1 n=1 Tax=Dentiscutata erythropus TaxID=1348616 RepID=A0A9N8VPP0_9GLOM|nr:18317_t:CDS:2 [Dentiscutata erythropus]
MAYIPATAQISLSFTSKTNIIKTSTGKETAISISNSTNDQAISQAALEIDFSKVDAHTSILHVKYQPT